VDYNVHADVRNSPNYLITRPDDRDRAIQRLVVLMQMTYVGAPMIYNGDEAGMWGAGDPDNRQPMVWADMTYDPQSIDPRTGAQPPQAVGFDKELFAYYRGAIALRRTHPALDRGDYALLAADDAADTIVFLRRGSSESLIIAINRSANAQNVTVTAPTDRDAALLAKPAILFSTTEPATAAGVSAARGKLSLLLPPLTGVVVGPAGL
jgi:cyclomaltodextrinase